MVENTKNDEFDQKVMQANFSAVLYLLTEQQALIGKLLQTLLETGVITAHQLQKVTDIHDGEEGLIPTYTELYKRFASYYLRTKQLLDEGSILDRALDEALKDRDDEKGKDDE